MGFSEWNGGNRLFLGTGKFTSTNTGTVVAHDFCAFANRIPCSTALEVYPSSRTARVYRTPQRQKQTRAHATRRVLRYDHSSAGTVGSACEPDASCDAPRTTSCA